MNLTCPSCTTTFVVESAQLGPKGRRVRCGGCGHSWFQAAEDAAEGEPPAASGTQTTVATAPAGAVAEREHIRDAASRRRGPKVPRPRESVNGRSSLLLGWLLFLVVIGGLAAGLYYGREQVMALAPAAGPFYEMIGLSHPSTRITLELRDVRTVRRILDGEQVVVVEGLVTNMTDEPQAVPLLRASLTDGSGAEVEAWTFAASATALPPGGTTGFETTAKKPPREGSITIDFVATN